jgi:hypothetical protein
MIKKSSYFLIFLLFEGEYFIHSSLASDETIEHKPLLRILSEDLKDYPLLNPKIPEGKYDLKNPKNIVGQDIYLPLYDSVIGKEVALKCFRILEYNFRSNKDNNIDCLERLLNHKSSTFTPHPYQLSSKFKKHYGISHIYFIEDDYINRALKIVRASNFGRLDFTISKDDPHEYRSEGSYFNSDAHYKITLKEARFFLDLGGHISKISKNEKFANIYFTFE